MIRYCSIHHGPPEPGDEVYALWDERKVCMACVVEVSGEAERAWLSERLGFIEDRGTAADILWRLYGPK